MGNETIFYYVTEEAVTGQKRTVKLRFWQKMQFSSFVVEKEGLTIVAVMIPVPQKGWKREKLLRLMQETMEKHPLYSGNVRILIQPGVQAFLTEYDGQGGYDEDALDKPERRRQSDTFLSICFPLSEKILRERFLPQRRKGGPEAVVFLLGTLFFPEEQLREFSEMIQPYLPWVNALTIIYEPEEAQDALREPGYLEEVIDRYTEEFYYEYGLVSQVICGKDAPARRCAQSGGQSPVLFLDYGYPGTYPLRMLKEGDIYLDIASSEEKEALFRRKYRGIFYQSPRKYLDTMVKSGYDK